MIGGPTDSYTRFLGTTSPLGGQRMHVRLNSITKRLDKLQKKLQSRASRTIADRSSHYYICVLILLLCMCPHAKLQSRASRTIADRA